MNAIRNPTRVLIVSAADSRFLPLLQGMIASLAPVLASPDVDLACFDIGLAPADLEWMRSQNIRTAIPGGHFGLNADDYKAPLRSFLARPFLRDYFPGYTVYVWIDSDVWLQDPAVVQAYVDGALRSGMAVAHEGERAYRFQPWLLGWTGKHFLKGYGVVTGASLLARRHLNAGFFAAAADAPHWAAWGARYEAAIKRSGALVPHDQFSLVQAVHTGGGAQKRRLPTELLDPGHNWICDRGVPMWHDQLGVFCKPYAPFQPIGALHLAGPAKTTAYAVKRTDGGFFTTFITHGASPASPAIEGPLAAPRTPVRTPREAVSTVGANG